MENMSALEKDSQGQVLNVRFTPEGLWYQANHLPSLGLHFLTYEMRLEILVLSLLCKYYQL